MLRDECNRSHEADFKHRVKFFYTIFFNSEKFSLRVVTMLVLDCIYDACIDRVNSRILTTLIIVTQRVEKKKRAHARWFHGSFSIIQGHEIRISRSDLFR